MIQNSDKACELLIQCMDYLGKSFPQIYTKVKYRGFFFSNNRYLDLPYLIQKLMPRITTEDQREKMVYIALISKALLHLSWASHSILFYIDLVR